MRSVDSASKRRISPCSSSHEPACISCSSRFRISPICSTARMLKLPCSFLLNSRYSGRRYANIRSDEFLIRTSFDTVDRIVIAGLSHTCGKLAEFAEQGAVVFMRSAGGNQRLNATRSEEHTSELQSRENLVCRLLLEK